MKSEEVRFNILEIRTAARMTHEELAKESGVSAATISRIESGNANDNISIDSLYRIADAFDLSVDFMFKGRPDRFTSEELCEFQNRFGFTDEQIANMF